MTTGQGIAVAGVWLLPCAALISATTSAYGAWVAMLVSFIITCMVLAK